MFFQAAHSQSATLDVRTQTAVTSSFAGNVTQGSQTVKTQATIQGVSVSSAIAAAQVVVATHSPPISQSQEAVVHSAPSQFIAVAGEIKYPLLLLLKEFLSCL